MLDEICFRTNNFYMIVILCLSIMGWTLYQVYLQGLENSRLQTQAEYLIQKEKDLIQKGKEQAQQYQAEMKTQSEQEQKKSKLSNLEQLIEQKI